VYNTLLNMPHLEADGAEVRNTEHVTGDVGSDNARKAHALLREHPERYDEVADDKGEVCVTDGVEQTSQNQ
jgi:hypothetical protein